MFTCEYMVPCTWDWTMYRGWYKGGRTFGNAQVPWEFCVAEWSSQFLGDRAYRISEAEKKNLRWEAEQFRNGRLWHRWDYPYQVGSTVFDIQHEIIGAYLTANWRAFRTWGVSAISPWEHDFFWSLRKGVDKSRKQLPVDWEGLQRPGFSAGLHRRTVRTHGPGLPALRLDPDRRRAGHLAEQPAAVGLHRREAGGIHEQGPQFLPGRNGRETDSSSSTTRGRR